MKTVNCERCKRELDREISNKSRHYRPQILCAGCLRQARKLEQFGDITARWERMLSDYRKDPLNPYRY
jgi:hypothetical protein